MPSCTTCLRAFNLSSGFPLTFATAVLFAVWSNSKGVEKLSAEDLYALGACNEAIGETDTAKGLYASSLAASPATNTQVTLNC